MLHTNIGMTDTSFIVIHHALLYVGSTNDAILEDMKKAYMDEQESKEKNK